MGSCLKSKGYEFNVLILIFSQLVRDLYFFQMVRELIYLFWKIEFNVLYVDILWGLNFKESQIERKEKVRLGRYIFIEILGINMV